MSDNNQAIAPTPAATLQPVGAAPAAMVPGELGVTAAATRATAEVQARYVMALQRPRNMDGVRVRLLNECGKFHFADSALYRLPVGGKNQTGLSIRFAEAARLAMTNMLCSRTTLFDSETTVVARVTVVDLEANTTVEREVSLEKIVERRAPRRGEVPISTRVGSEGQTVYICRPGKSEIATMLGAECAKAERECTLKLLPPDLKAECRARIDEALRTGATGDDGEQRRKQLVDAFARVGVTPEDLIVYLGHPLSQLSPAEFSDLRGVHEAMVQEGVSWSAFVESAGGGEAKTGAAASKTSATKDALKARKAAAS